jgi:outer membrane biosynthesis protein TonB
VDLIATKRLENYKYNQMVRGKCKERLNQKEDLPYPRTYGNILEDVQHELHGGVINSSDLESSDDKGTGKAPPLPPVQPKKPPKGKPKAAQVKQKPPPKKQARKGQAPPSNRLRDMPADVFDKFTEDELSALHKERNPSVDTTESEEEPNGAGGAAVVQIDLTGSPPAQQGPAQEVYIDLTDAAD